MRHARRENRVTPRQNDALLRGYLDQWLARHRGELSVSDEEFVRVHTEAMEMLLASTEKLGAPVEIKLCDALHHAVRTVSNPIHAAILTRSIEAIVRMSAGLDEAASAGLLANSSDYEFLIDILRRSPVEQPQEGHPLREARLRGLEMRERIMTAEGGCWSAEEVGRHLGISRQAVDRRRQKRQLLALPIGGKAYAYPSWQFVESGVLPGVVEVLGAFTLPGPWTRAAFFLSPNTLLGEARPLDELRQGSVEKVKQAAASYGEQIAA